MSFRKNNVGNDKPLERGFRSRARKSRVWGLERAEVMLGRTSQEVMPGVASGEVRLAARGSDAASQEATKRKKPK
ncbi:hypothetical protein Theba_2274 [Mesotoga prima MesG1.Ag.4.2]|uniref:Uncharacterized protein n=1 Tax=Mesotoga prima MesG1.Ag.4.2 TaxID=660470 RepID=I2F7K0_9BACT|nr:hypothetical protein [Mesotoga prima]AFK07903.1 hypothetical protein Theba_2274 [Mesotoga prima MesG1.Ag.4.2]